MNNQPIQFTFKPGKANSNAVQLRIQDSVSLEAKFPEGIVLMGVHYALDDLLKIDQDAFWDDLPSLGRDTGARIIRIKELFPITAICPDPRVNRRKLYQQIYYLRTQCVRGWEFDKFVKKIPGAETSMILSHARLQRGMVYYLVDEKNNAFGR